MATDAFQSVMTKEPTNSGISWKYTEALTAAGNGKTVFVPSGLKHLAVSITASAGAKLQVTMDPINIIQADTEDYIDWPEGEVTTEKDMALSPAITAFRLVQTQAGTSDIKARGVA